MDDQEEDFFAGVMDFTPVEPPYLKPLSPEE